MKYIDADTIREATEFLRNGGDKERAAAYLGCKPKDLPKLLDLPSLKPVPTDQDQDFDLWSVDRAKEVL
ncbi:MAG: hypothetical protein NT138_05435 [Planctomycetales bacterium]|nr:hypothetical protein [Planctomycetales bacterium]